VPLGLVAFPQALDYVGVCFIAKKFPQASLRSSLNFGDGAAAMAASGFVEFVFGRSVEYNVERQAVGHGIGVSRDACDFKIPSQRHFVEEHILSAGHDSSSLL
jgi:hypothetical protein